MSPELKAAGDSVLELYGISPSELVRTLWMKVSLGEEALRQVAEALAEEPSAASAMTTPIVDGTARSASWIRLRQSDLERELRLDPSTYVPLSEEELDVLVYEDYLEEMGTHHAG